MKNGTIAGVLAVTFGAGAWGGWYVAPRELLDEQAHHTGPFQVDRTHILSAAVNSLRAENRLVVLSVTGSITVKTERKVVIWPLRGAQLLVVPTAYTYSIDLSKLTLADVTYDERAKVVRVHLPRLEMGEIAFQSEGAIVLNEGLITWSDAQVQALMRANYRGARLAAIKQAQQASLTDMAKRQAVIDVSKAFEIPLRIAGMPDVKVAASF